MSDFGITGVRWNTSRTEVDSCRLHGLDEADGTLRLGEGYEAKHPDVSSLIVCGHRVWVMGGSDKNHRLKEVKVRDKSEHLYTVPVSSLFELTEF